MFGLFPEWLFTLLPSIMLKYVSVQNLVYLGNTKCPKAMEKKNKGISGSTIVKGILPGSWSQHTSVATSERPHLTHHQYLVLSCGARDSCSLLQVWEQSINKHTALLWISRGAVTLEESTSTSEGRISLTAFILEINFPHQFLGKWVMKKRALAGIHTDKDLNPSSPIYQLYDLGQKTSSLSVMIFFHLHG